MKIQMVSKFLMKEMKSKTNLMKRIKVTICLIVMKNNLLLGRVSKIEDL